MTTELIADPVIQTSVIPNGMSINPLFDWMPILGIPLWIYIGIVCVLFVISVFIYWLLRMNKLASVKGWAESLNKMTQDDVQVWVISRVQKLTIECMTSKDNVLSSHDPTNISMYHINSAQGVISVGGARAVIISEDYDQNRDIIAELALCCSSEDFNNRQESLKAELNQKYQVALLSDPDSEKPSVVKPIRDFEAYESYGYKCLQMLNPNGLTIPAYNIYNPNKFRKYFPRGCSGMWYGGELIHDARKLNARRPEKNFWDNNLFLMIASGIALTALVVSWLFPLGSG